MIYRPSKLARRIANLRQELRTGRTRSKKPRPLSRLEKVKRQKTGELPEQTSGSGTHSPLLTETESMDDYEGSTILAETHQSL